MRIALSGLSGAGSSTTARLVGERLALPMSNFTLRNLAVERGVPFEDLQKQAAHDSEIDFELDRRLTHFIESHEDCLVATDLACWLDAPQLQEELGNKKTFSFDYKIWLEVPLEERVSRIQKREGGERDEIRHYHNQRDHENHERYLALYNVDIFNHDHIDWIFDTSALSLDEAVRAICAKIEQLTST